MCVEEGGEEDEWLAVRLTHVFPALTLVNCYGEQEGSCVGRSNKEEVVARWGRLLKVLESARLRGDHCLLIGDLNKHIGNDHLGVKGNNCEISAGGRLVRDLLEGGQWRLVNAMEEVVEGGPFTRRDPATGKESLLDLWICTAGLAPHFKELYIDSSRKWEVARPVRKAGRLQLTHTDHYTMVACLQNLPAARVARKEQEVRWKTGDKEGWARYKEKSKNAGQKIKDIVENKDTEIDAAIEKIEAIENKLKYEAIGKYKTASDSKRTARKVKQQKDMSEEEKAKELLERQIQHVEESVSEIERKGPSKVGRIYEISKQIKGIEKGAAQATAIKDPTNGKLIVDREAIKKRTIEYCKEVLTKNEPAKEFKAIAMLKQKLHDGRMIEKLEEGFSVDKEVFDKVLNKFKKNNKRGHDFLTKASEEFQDSIYLLCKRIIQEEKVPDNFRETTLHQIWKKKPGTKKEDLEANRYIHVKNIFLGR